MKVVKNIPFEIYLILIGCLSIFLVNPIGDFPLNDDWAYSQSVWSLYQHGELTMNNWPAMTLVAQVVWGTLFCKVFGLSFLSLRISTLLTGLFGIITYHKLAERFSLNKHVTAFSTLVIFFNPLFFSLSFTFMTDVHFLSFMLFSIYFFFKYLDKEKTTFLLLATLFSVVSTMIRQPGIIIPLAFALTLLQKRKDIRRIFIVIIPFTITLGFLLLHSLWLNKIVENPVKVAGINELIGSLISIDLYQILVRISKTFLYAGLFLLPLLMLYWKNIKNNFIKAKLKATIIIIPVVILLLIGGVHYPANNILYNLGLGPKVLKDSYWNMNLSPHINDQVWIVFMKILSVSGAVMLLLALSPKIRPNKNEFQDQNSPAIDQAKVFLFFIIAGYIILLLISSSYFDRYVIPLLCFASLLIISKKIDYSGFQKYLATGFLAVMILFSIAATHDYLSWNRARWKAANFLLNELKISPEEIDGGFEFNGWFNAGPCNPHDRKGKSWWFVTDDEYVISFGAVDGYNKIGSFYYSQRLSFNQDSIYILKRPEK
jgi:hypothetical protein